MTATMTRLPSESFWPSGALDSDVRLPFPGLGSESSSVISPLSLPRGDVSYFDQATIKANPATQVVSASPMPSRNATVRGNRVYSPLSLGVRGPDLPQLPQFLSPHLAPVGRDTAPQHRSASLPPSHRDSSFGPSRSRTGTAPTPRAVAALGLMQGPAVNGALANGAGAVPNGAMSSIGSVSGGHPRTISADSASAPSQAQMIRRLVQQNGRIREAWEAERKYLEANRERAEEVYKEERALMEEERTEWEAEKEVLLREIGRLRQQVSSMGGGSKTPHATSQSLRGGGAWETSPEGMRSSLSSQENNHRSMPTIRNAVSLPQLHADGPLNRGLLGLEPSSFRVGSSTELAVVPEVEADPVPVVDVQEIHPELEGIPIKANTIQKATFTDVQSGNGSKSSSRTSSPPNRPRISSQESKEQTLQVLAAEASERLTMHAGHTPSHSMSVVPTVSSSGAQTARSSGDSTPTMLQGDGSSSQDLVTAPEVDEGAGFYAAASTDPLSEYHHEPEVMFEPTEDRQLKGPLMVRNMPAHDEIFFRRLSDKLEEVSKGDQASLPAVLKDIDQASDVTDPTQAQLLQAEPEAGPKLKPDVQVETQSDGASSTASDSGTEKERRSPENGGGEELDIPLKFKRSTNFGAPFGTFR